MLSFLNDYSEGCAKEVLEALVQTNALQTVGYGFDEYTLKAKEIIRKQLGDNDAVVEFLVGGTQTNLVGLATLRCFEAIIACDSGHINVHEAGAIEGIGHKIITIPHQDGKLNAQLVDKLVGNIRQDIHMAQPKMVYISNTTEYGTFYTKAELMALRQVCDKYDLYLFLDGARLGSALTAEGNDLTLKDIYELTDIFYIGGTKNGLLFGEALIIRNDNLKVGIKTLIKQKGALLAKGRLLGLQFYTIFKDDLYYKYAKQANEMADLIRNKLNSLGAKLYGSSNTNQIFVYLTPAQTSLLQEKVRCEIFDKHDDVQIIRFVTSFMTTLEDVEALNLILEKILA